MSWVLHHLRADWIVNFVRLIVINAICIKRPQQLNGKPFQIVTVYEQLPWDSIPFLFLSFLITNHLPVHLNMFHFQGARREIEKKQRSVSSVPTCSSGVSVCGNVICSSQWCNGKILLKVCWVYSNTFHASDISPLRPIIVCKWLVKNNENDPHDRASYVSY